MIGNTIQAKKKGPNVLNSKASTKPAIIANTKNKRISVCFKFKSMSLSFKYLFMLFDLSNL